VGVTTRCAQSNDTAVRPGTRYDRREMTVRITKAELARDIHSILDRVQEGVEIVVEQDHRAIAVIKSPGVRGRKISAVIAALEASGAHALKDESPARDVEEGIKFNGNHGIRPPGINESIRASLSPRNGADSLLRKQSGKSSIHRADTPERSRVRRRFLDMITVPFAVSGFAIAAHLIAERLP